MAAVTVETEHSRYDFDLSNKTVTRTRVDPAASHLDGDGVAREYDTIHLPGVGEPLVIWYGHGLAGIRVSTAVTKIVEG